jgi:hypothetical protein
MDPTKNQTSINLLSKQLNKPKIQLKLWKMLFVSMTPTSKSNPIFNSQPPEQINTKVLDQGATPLRCSSRACA